MGGSRGGGGGSPIRTAATVAVNPVLGVQALGAQKLYNDLGEKILNPQVPAGAAPTAAGEVPTPGQASTDAKTNAAAAEERTAKSRAATILTGGTGDTSKATVSRRTLLGS